jgi:hypothetical protein
LQARFLAGLDLKREGTLIVGLVGLLSPGAAVGLRLAFDE